MVFEIYLLFVILGIFAVNSNDSTSIAMQLLVLKFSNHNLNEE